MGKKKDSTITFNRADFLEVLKLMELASSKDVKLVEYADNLLFLKDYIAAYDGTKYVLMEVKTGLEGSVKLNEFKTYLGRMAEEEIEFSMKKNQLVVQTKETPFSFGLSWYDPGQTHDLIKTLIKQEKDIKWKRMPKDLASALVLCSFSASKDIKKGPLCGVYLDGKDVISSDNYRISWYERKQGMAGGPYLIPARSTVNLLLFDTKEYAINERWAHFKGAGFIYGTQLMGPENFPGAKATKFFPQKTGKGLALPKEELITALDDALVMLQDENILSKQCQISVEAKKIKVDVERKGYGWYKRAVKFKGTGIKKPITFKINPVFLKEVIKRDMTFNPNSENKNIALFLMEDYKHLISLG